MNTTVTITATCVGVSKEDQAITFGAQGGQTYSTGGTFAISPLATADSELAVSYSSLTSGVCTVSGSTITMVSAGTCTIAANQAGDDDYKAAPQVTQNVTIAKGEQTITFGAQGGQAYSASGTFALSPAAEASSGLDVSYSSTTPAVCSVSGSTVTTLSAGTCTIAANQPGSSGYNAAAEVTQSIAIAKGDQTITFGAQGGQTYSPAGTFALSPSALASSTLLVSYSSLTTSVCTISGTTVTTLSAGTCTIAADQAGNDDYNAAAQVTQDIEVAKASQTITFGAQSGQTFSPSGTFAISTGSADSELSVSYSSLSTSVCTVSGTTVSMVSAGTCTIAANQAGDGNYNAAAQTTQDVTIAKGAQTISFTAPEDQPFAPGLTVPLAATASSGLTVTFASNSTTICTVSGATATVLALGTCSITASQSGDGNYNAAEDVTQTFEVEQSVTLTSLSFSPSNPLLGQSVTISVSVTSLGGTPEGTISVFDGVTSICTFTLVSGAGSCVTTFETDGAHTLSAEYAGNPYFAPSTSDPVTATVVDQRGRTVGVIGEFLSQRNNQILSNEPGARRQIDRLQNAARSGGSGAPVAFPWPSGLSSAGAARQDGQGIASLPVQVSITEQGRLGDLSFAGALGTPGEAGYVDPEFNPFDVWFEGKFTLFDGDGQSEGRFGLLSAGVDYVVNPDLLVGLMMQMDSLHMKNEDDPWQASGVGYLIGPYSTVRLVDQIFLQTRAAWGQSTNEVSPFDTYTDSFASTRWLLSAKLTGSWTSGPWRIDPSAGIAYMRDSSDAYLDTFGVLIPGVVSELGQARAGAEISYGGIVTESAVIEPFAGAQLIWNFANDVSTGTALDVAFEGGSAGVTGARGSVELGLRSRTIAGSSLDLSVRYDGIGAKDFGAWSGKMSASMPMN